MDPPPDFTNNSAWYDMKLYTDGTKTNVNKGIRPQAYGDMMTRVFKIMNLPTKHTAHIGRTLGPKALEMLEFSQDEIRILGNWDPKTQESTYSSKLPMAPIRAMAGFRDAGGSHYNPRTAVVVPEELSKLVFPWLAESKEKLERFEAENRSSPFRETAQKFLEHLERMAEVVVQDVAVMKLLHPDRCENCLLMEHSLFDSDLFVSFTDEMKKALQEVDGNDPTKATLDTVLPGVHQQFSNLHNEITRVRVALEDWKDSGDFRGVTGKSTTVCRDVFPFF
jgi:hypothetical protein